MSAAIDTTDHREEIFMTLSDLHKEAYGFRPLSNNWKYYRSLNDEELKAVFQELSDTADDRIAEEKRMQAEAVVEFEKAIQETIELGAGDRETAVRWLREAGDAEDGGYDDGYFKFCHDLPYEYDPVTGEGG